MKKAIEKVISIVLPKLQIYSVWLVGISPLMLHRYAVEPKKPGDRTKPAPTPEQEARASCYFCEDGVTIGIKAENITRMLLNAGKHFKGRKSSRATAQRDLAAGATILPNFDAVIPILVNGHPATEKDYVIDSRRAVIGKAAVLRSRPKFLTWELKFDIEIDPELVSAESLPETFVIGGLREGLGDFRPGANKPGPYGRFTFKSGAFK